MQGLRSRYVNLICEFSWVGIDKYKGGMPFAALTLSGAAVLLLWNSVPAVVSEASVLRGENFSFSAKRSDILYGAAGLVWR